MQPALSFSPRLQCVSQGGLQQQSGDGANCVTIGSVGLGSRFPGVWEAASEGGKDALVVLRSVSPGAWETVLRAGEWGLAAQTEAHAHVHTEVGGLVLVDGGYAGVVLEVVADAWLGI